jgi:hypothetical protein
MAAGPKTDLSSNPTTVLFKELLITFLAGFLFFLAFALLRDQARNDWREGPASTVYGEF